MIQILLALLIIPTLASSMENSHRTSKSIPNINKTFATIARVLAKTNGNTDQAITKLQSTMSTELLNATFDNLTIGNRTVLNEFFADAYNKSKSRTDPKTSLNNILKLKFAKYLSWYLCTQISAELSPNIFNEILLIITTLLDPLKITSAKSMAGKELKANDTLCLLWTTLANECLDSLNDKGKYINKAIQELCILIEIEQKIILESQANNIEDKTTIKSRANINALINLHNQQLKDNANILFDRTEQQRRLKNNVKILELQLNQMHILGKQNRLEDLIDVASRLIAEIYKQIQQNPPTVHHLKPIYNKTQQLLYQYLNKNPDLLCQATHTIAKLPIYNFTIEMAQIARNMNDIENAYKLSPTSSATASRKRRRTKKIKKEKNSFLANSTLDQNSDKTKEQSDSTPYNSEYPKPQDSKIDGFQNTDYIKLAIVLLQQENYSKAIEALKKITPQNRFISNYKTYLEGMILCRLAHKIYLEEPKLNYKPLLKKVLSCINEVIESENKELTEAGLCYNECIAMLKKCSTSYIYSFASQCSELLSRQKL